MENHSRFVWVRFLLLVSICCVHACLHKILYHEGQISGASVGELAAPLKTCSRRNPKSCADIKMEKPSLPSQTCLIYPFGISEQSVEAWCDFETDGGGWTIIQKRSSGPKEEFYRNWKDYEEGFGSADKNYWLGLEAIHALTKGRDQELRIDLQDFEGDQAYAKYSTFSISDSLDYYRLTIGGYSGTANDSIRFQNTRRFSTKDKDNDRSSLNCAESRRGAWWYNNCSRSNLNGFYYQKGEKPDPEESGIVWCPWKSCNSLLSKVEMKIRQRR